MQSPEEIVFESVNWIELAHNVVQWWALVNVVTVDLAWTLFRGARAYLSPIKESFRRLMCHY
jgi:hypothetical protein